MLGPEHPRGTCRTSGGGARASISEDEAQVLKQGRVLALAPLLFFYHIGNIHDIAADRKYEKPLAGVIRPYERSIIHGLFGILSLTAAPVCKYLP